MYFRVHCSTIRGCLKSWLLFRHPREFKIKSLYSNDLILNIASKSKETVQKLKFLDSPLIYSLMQLLSYPILLLGQAENAVPVVGRGLLDKCLAFTQIGIGGTVIRTLLAKRLKELKGFFPIPPVEHAMGFLKAA